jgi:hypothetical protein
MLPDRLSDADSAMETQRRIISIATGGLLLVSLAAMRFVGASAPVACTLLTAKDATTALEAQSQPGKELVDPGQ